MKTHACVPILAMLATIVCTACNEAAQESRSQGPPRKSKPQRPRFTLVRTSHAMVIYRVDQETGETWISKHGHPWKLIQEPQLIRQAPPQPIQERPAPDLKSMMKEHLGMDRLQKIIQPSLDLATARGNVENISKAIELYYADKHRIPEEIADLSPFRRFGRPTIVIDKVDPWGNPYEIRPGVTDGSWEVRSSGPDHLPDTEDDITHKGQVK